MRVFISYRRGDLNGHAQALVGRIYDQLVGLYGKRNIFMDVSSIPFGENFPKVLNQKVAGSDVLLAIIGPQWSGFFKRDSDSPDFVEIEIAAAIEENVSIIPVMIGGATMPGKDELPESLATLPYLNSLPLDSGQDFQLHFNRLKEAIEKTHIIEEAEDREDEQGNAVRVLKAGGQSQKRNVRQVKREAQPDLSIVLGSILDPRTNQNRDSSIEFVYIPGGDFAMGSDEPWADRIEKPRHRVTITEGYWLAKCLVTADQSNLVVEKSSVTSPIVTGPQPAVFVDWQSVENFCQLMNEKYRELLPGGYRFYPPTEAQWEMACRTGNDKDARFYPCKGLFGQIMVCPKPLDGGKQPVGSTRPNVWGLHDLMSLTREWCSDIFSEDFYDWKFNHEEARIDPEVTFSINEYSGFYGSSWSNDMIARSVRGIPAGKKDQRLTMRGAGVSVASDKLRDIEGRPEDKVLGFSFRRGELECINHEWWHPIGLRLAIRTSTKL